MKHSFTEEQLLEMLVETMGNPVLFEYKDEDAQRVFKDMGNIEGVHDLLRNVMGRDMQLYFLAQDDAGRASIRGAYQRMAWIRGYMQKAAKAAELKTVLTKREAK